MSTEELEGQEPQQEELEASQEQTPEPAELTDTEKEAQKYGWRPKSEFTLPPDKWVEADEYLSFPTTQNRILRDELRAYQKNTDELVSARVGAVEKMLQEASEARFNEQKAAHEAEIARIKAGQLEAVQSGDVQAFQTLEQQAARLTEPQKPAPAPNQAAQEVEAYRKANEWTQDPVMWQAAINAVGNAPHLSASQQLQLGERAVRQMFPDKFEAPKPKPAPRQRVDGGGLGGAAKAGKGVRDLPPEAKKQGKKFVEDGLFGSLEEYAAAYHSQ